jgi:hypothetical protein
MHTVQTHTVVGITRNRHQIAIHTQGRVGFVTYCNGTLQNLPKTHSLKNNKTPLTDTDTSLTDCCAPYNGQAVPAAHGNSLKKERSRRKTTRP